MTIGLDQALKSYGSAWDDLKAIGKDPSALADPHFLKPLLLHVGIASWGSLRAKTESQRLATLHPLFTAPIKTSAILSGVIAAGEGLVQLARGQSPSWQESSQTFLSGLSAGASTALHLGLMALLHENALFNPLTAFAVGALSTFAIGAANALLQGDCHEDWKGLAVASVFAGLNTMVAVTTGGLVEKTALAPAAKIASEIAIGVGWDVGSSLAEWGTRGGLGLLPQAIDDQTSTCASERFSQFLVQNVGSGIVSALAPRVIDGYRRESLGARTLNTLHTNKDSLSRELQGLANDQEAYIHIDDYTHALHFARGTAGTHSMEGVSHIGSNGFHLFGEIHPDTPVPSVEDILGMFHDFRYKTRDHHVIVGQTERTAGPLAVLYKKVNGELGVWFSDKQSLPEWRAQFAQNVRAAKARLKASPSLLETRQAAHANRNADPNRISIRTTGHDSEYNDETTRCVVDGEVLGRLGDYATLPISLVITLDGRNSRSYRIVDGPQVLKPYSQTEDPENRLAGGTFTAFHTDNEGMIHAAVLYILVDKGTEGLYGEVTFQAQDLNNPSRERRALDAHVAKHDLGRVRSLLECFGKSNYRILDSENEGHAWVQEAIDCKFPYELAIKEGLVGGERRLIAQIGPKLLAAPIAPKEKTRILYRPSTLRDAGFAATFNSRELQALKPMPQDILLCSQNGSLRLRCHATYGGVHDALSITDDMDVRGLSWVRHYFDFNYDPTHMPPPRLFQRLNEWITYHNPYDEITYAPFPPDTPLPFRLPASRTAGIKEVPRYKVSMAQATPEERRALLRLGGSARARLLRVNALGFTNHPKRWDEGSAPMDLYRGVLGQTVVNGEPVYWYIDKTQLTHRAWAIDAWGRAVDIDHPSIYLLSHLRNLPSPARGHASGVYDALTLKKGEVAIADLHHGRELIASAAHAYPKWTAIFIGRNGNKFTAYLGGQYPKDYEAIPVLTLPPPLDGSEHPNTLRMPFRPTSRLLKYTFDRIAAIEAEICAGTLPGDVTIPLFRNAGGQYSFTVGGTHGFIQLRIRPQADDPSKRIDVLYTDLRPNRSARASADGGSGPANDPLVVPYALTPEEVRDILVEASYRLEQNNKEAMGQARITALSPDDFSVQTGIPVHPTPLDASHFTVEPHIDPRCLGALLDPSRLLQSNGLESD